MNKLVALAVFSVLTVAFALAQDTTTKPQPPRSANNQGQAVTGKAPANTGAREKPKTTTGSAGQTTPGAETESGVEQQPGGNSDVPHTGPANPNAGKQSKTIQPKNQAEVGQTADEADIAAQAAQRAEIVPGHTQGVDGQTGNIEIVPSKGSRAGVQSPTLPQSEPQAGRTKIKGEKSAAPKSSRTKSTAKKPDTSTSNPQ